MAASSDISASGSPPKPTERFSGRAEAYLRGRPRYPQNLVPFLSEKLGLAPAHVIADIGSGTGFLTEPFLANDNVVYAIEPNDAMRSAAESWLGKHRDFHSINATAEATTLADRSVDFITAGQAFHWFEPTTTRKEFARILRQSSPHVGATGAALECDGFTPSPGTPGEGRGGGLQERSPSCKTPSQPPPEYRERRNANAHPPHLGVAPGGMVILVWNERRRDDPFAIEYQQLVDRHSLDEPAARARQDSVEPASIKSFFAPSSCELASLSNHQDLDAQGLIDRLLSISHMPGPDHPLQDRLIEAARELFLKHAQNDRIRMNYNTNIFYGRL